MSSTGDQYGLFDPSRKKPRAKQGKVSEFDLAAGLARQEAGIDLVSGNSGDFIPDALRAIVRLGKFRGPSEALREHLEGLGIVPHDSHAWGALTQSLLRIGWFRNTGERTRMRSERSNGRDTAVYELCLDGSMPPVEPRVAAPTPAAQTTVAWDAELQQLTDDFEREFPELATLVGGPKNGIWHCWFRRLDGAKEPLPPKSEAKSMGAALLAGYATARKWAVIQKSRRSMSDA